MLPTFVIGLREGLEAALIIGIIAAFLRKQGRRDLLRSVLAGVGVAIAVCAVAGVALDVYSRSLPQKQQEGLETVIGVLAVGMVTYMVVWMRRHSRQLKGQLEGLAAGALASGGPGRSTAGRAMILMAFLAVIREGFETVVFLLAAFNESGSGVGAGAGAVLGIVVAVGLGYGIYRGGVRLNLSKFFRATGLVLVLVAAGLLVNALHTAHEAGWLDLGQGGTVDLSWLVQPGTVQASLLTGMLGIQTHPVIIEVAGWLAYLVPVGCYVAWPPGKPVPGRALARAGVAVAGAAGAAAVLLAVLAPAAPARRPVTDAGGAGARVIARSADTATVRTRGQWPVERVAGVPTNVRLTAAGSSWHADRPTETFRAAVAPAAAGSRPAEPDAAGSRPATLSAADVARLNGGRLPIGLAGAAAYPVTYRSVRTLTVWLDSRLDRVVDLRWSEQVTATVHTATGAYPLPVPVAAAQRGLDPGAVRQAAAAARAARDDLDRRRLLQAAGAGSAVLAALALLAAAGFGLAARRRVVPAGVAPRADAPAHPEWSVTSASGHS